MHTFLQSFTGKFQITTIEGIMKTVNHHQANTTVIPLRGTWKSLYFICNFLMLKMIIKKLKENGRFGWKNLNIGLVCRLIAWKGPALLLCRGERELREETPSRSNQQLDLDILVYSPWLLTVLSYFLFHAFYSELNSN